MPAKLSVTLVDDYGRTTNRTYGMVTQATLAEYIAAADALLAALEAVTDLGCTGAEIRIVVPSAAFAVTSDANKDVGATAVGYIQDGDGKKASHKWPGVKATLVGADGTIPITSVVATYLALFEDAADLTISDGEQIESWIKATLDG
jgi:hypothetical protein